MDLSWMDHAACREVGTEPFFPTTNVDGMAVTCYAEAKKICASCTVSPQCLEYALRLNIEHGLFGGLTERERRVIRRRRDAA